MGPSSVINFPGRVHRIHEGVVGAAVGPAPVGIQFGRDRVYDLEVVPDSDSESSQSSHSRLVVL